ncbi:MAG: exodeoxyribonuclease VII large subunit [Nitrospirae bacterium]|nr:exodeoxyribonuclease VII large subunit [Nitrospirota bacterium]
MIDRNKRLELPVVPQRVAVISSPTAAGYGDFFNHLDNNPYGYRFIHTLFPALMQGNEAEKSIIEALNDIRRTKEAFDLVVIIRGGGSVTDLSCFDSYNLCSRVANFPLPVITGIGHEKDDTVMDIVAHTKMKTPTAVAEFLIAGARGFEEAIAGLLSRLISYAERQMKTHRLLINTLSQKILLAPTKLTMSHGNRLSIIRRDLGGHARHRLTAEKNRLGGIGQALRHLDPANVLKRGYSITTVMGKIIKDASLIREGMEIQTRLYEGALTSIVRAGKEVRTGGKVKRDDLLPGFE